MNLDSILQLLPILVSLIALVISVVSFRIAVRQSKTSASDRLTSAYGEISTIALSSNENLICIDELHFPVRKPDTIENKRKRWSSFLALNAIELAFVSKRNNLIEAQVADPIINDLLRKLLRDEMVRAVIQMGFHDLQFQEHANKIIKELDAGGSAETKIL
ncbi:hypothetical protein L0337_17760 [candidate division KSB1 bacterium]|nr:hypothetical protein [candidate division KSB1 bacterium]